MKDYIKPTFILAGVTPLALSGNSCTVEKKEKQEISDIFGITDWAQAFAEGEGCATEYPITGYCKFTFSESTDNVIIGS